MATGIILASKIAAIVDDDGTGTTGTVIDKTWMQQLDSGDTINLPATPLLIQLSSTTQVEVFTAANKMRALTGTAVDNDAGEGKHVYLGRNTDASTPAAGFIAFEDKGGTVYYVWPDDSGVLRIHTSVPTNANDAAGTVVGTQT